MSDESYWITVHWPAREGEEPDYSGIWVPDQREEAGADLRPDDLVFVYESRTGRSELRVEPDRQERPTPRARGSEGVVALARVNRRLEADGGEESTRYVDGSEIWWRWHAPMTVIRTDGFVPRRRLNSILGYDRDYNLRGFGDRHSGLKRLEKVQFDAILAAFRREEGTATASPSEAVHARARGNGVESESHRSLKLYVAANPHAALGELGITTQCVEFNFPTGDRADVYLHDRFGRVMGVEIEVSVGDADFCGPLQALKYRSMLEFMAGRGAGEGRAVLVAYEISRKAQRLCKRYGIECHAVSEDVVKKWSRQTARENAAEQPHEPDGGQRPPKSE